MTSEIDASNSEYFNSATGVEKGKMKLRLLLQAKLPNTILPQQEQEF